MSIISYFVEPFLQFSFMQRALVGSLVLAASACPIGVFLMLRRLSLTGDAMAHAILPGAALGYLFGGLAIMPMTLGGLSVGLIVALGAGAISRFTIQREDASLAAFYLISLSAGVLLLSLKGSNVDLLHVLFGSVLALDDCALMLIGTVATLTFLGLAVVWRALVAECLDPVFFRTVSRLGSWAHYAFLLLVVLNLVAGFQALGTLLSVGLMILPAATARLWAIRLDALCGLAFALGSIASYVGLLLSYHLSLASGPAIILFAGLLYITSLLVAPRGLLRNRFHRRHRTA